MPIYEENSPDDVENLVPYHTAHWHHALRCVARAQGGPETCPAMPKCLRRRLASAHRLR
jgi:hypothetical protein